MVTTGNHLVSRIGEYRAQSSESAFQTGISSLENLPLTVHSQIPDEDRALSDGSFWWLLRSSERSVHWAIRGRLKATESQKCSKRPLFPNEIDGNDCVVSLFMVIGKRLLYLLGRARGWQASNSVEMCSASTVLANDRACGVYYTPYRKHRSRTWHTFASKPLTPRKALMCFSMRSFH